MRIYAVCERCGARTEVHRLGGRVDLRFEHRCDTTPDARPAPEGKIDTVDLAGGHPDPGPVF